MRLELPRLGVPDAIAAVLCGVCAVTTGAVLGHYPGVPGGAGAFAGAIVAAWLGLQRVRPSRVLRRAVWLRDGSWQLEFHDGRTAAASLGPGTRMLGRSVVLDWRLDDRSLRRWLTPWDVDDDQLRAMVVRLACAARLRTY